MLRKSLNISVILCIAFFAGCRKDKVQGTITPFELDYPTILESGLPKMIIPKDNLLTVEGVKLGRKLFYDKILSGDNTQACASCHEPKDGFTDNNLAFSEGIDGIEGSRNAMALVNLGWAQSYFWDGRSKTLEDQALLPVIDEIEMHATWTNAVKKLQETSEYPVLFNAAFNTFIIDSTLVAKALAQFERTLLSGNSPFDRYLLGLKTGYSLEEEIEMFEGYGIFLDKNKGDCFHCHGDQFNPLYTDNLFHNNGLDAVPTDPGLAKVTGNVSDFGKFKTPTLRNLLFTAPYMHDGRFETLSQVVDHYSNRCKNITNYRIH